MRKRIFYLNIYNHDISKGMSYNEARYFIKDVYSNYRMYIIEQFLNTAISVGYYSPFPSLKITASFTYRN